MTETSAQEQSTIATNNAPVNVEVDTSYENDSSYGDELSSYSASLTSSVLNYRYENGRRYHKYRDGSYLLPNDKSESDRLDMLHELCLQLLHRKLYLAPIKNSQRVINLGTGTGIWPVDFGDRLRLEPDPADSSFSERQVSGGRHRVGMNNQFDFIHARFLAVSIRDFGRLIKQCYRSVKPGGWVEFQDYDGYPYSEDGSLNDTQLQKYYDEIYGAFETAGYETRPGPKLENWFKDAGFVNVRTEKFMIPYGVWPKDHHLKKIGTWAQAGAEAGFESVALAALTRYKNWTKEEVIRLASEARADGRKCDLHVLFNL
ncbi:hypothetical protein VTN49DRAFT_3818 [Thermomyces lanuginosus]|uniref:uncharacterized protein n=1 Tax=Thermomyces lanuginosus TaxID=5541 RepID=UPI003743FAA8